jgi:transcriptional regulator with XRE-family HTH domain
VLGVRALAVGLSPTARTDFEGQLARHADAPLGARYVASRAEHHLPNEHAQSRDRVFLHSLYREIYGLHVEHDFYHDAFTAILQELERWKTDFGGLLARCGGNCQTHWGAAMGAKSPDNVDVQVGQRIRVLRQEANISQTALAEQLGVTFQQVQKYEKGVNRVGAGRLTRIAGVLGVPVSRLLGTDEERDVTTAAPQGGKSPLALLTTPGALRLLRAYAEIEDGRMRRSIVNFVENVASRKIEKTDGNVPSHLGNFQDRPLANH